MIERYIKHVLKENYNKDVKSLRINKKYEYISADTNDTVFYEVYFDFIDVVEHKNCYMSIKVDFNDYESKNEMYADYLEMTITM